MGKNQLCALATRLRKLKPACAERKDLTPVQKAHVQGQLQQWRQMVEELTNFCATTNPRFDRDRFLNACNGQ